jgi:hypothetical protein
MSSVMPRKSAAKPKLPPLTDAERHARFVAMAREVGVDESSEARDRALEKVTKPHRAVAS